MGELSVSLLRLGYLLLLWLFVLAALFTLRRDIYGTTIRRRDSTAAARGGRRRPKGRAVVGVPSELAGAPAAVPPAAPHFGSADAVNPAAYPSPAPVPTPGSVPARVPVTPKQHAPTRLVVKSGPLRGTTLPLSRAPVVIGRSSTANLVLDDEFTSGRHAQLVPRNGGWVLEDLGSTNGTFLGRERIAGPVELTAGQSIRIGNTTLEVLK
ncbi:MAG: FHA domain-containing protein [Bifidobacteriaceae bacterium]|jgi:hypothetical protein|nr:FHA domain-containing protein [Bifidobacteriaceae bacterium]